MIRTNHSPLWGSVIGREILSRQVFERMLTNRTRSGRVGSAPNGSSLSNRIRLLPLQDAISAVNGNFRRSSARNFAREPGFRTTNVPAAPTFTTSKAPSSLASVLGRNVLCPPTLMPRKKTIRAIQGQDRSKLSPPGASTFVRPKTRGGHILSFTTRRSGDELRRATCDSNPGGFQRVLG